MYIVSKSTCGVFDAAKNAHTALTFDDVTLEDKPSDVHPNDVNLKSFITKNIALKSAGIMSAAMDTVTEKELALAMAKMGGIGIIHRNMDPTTQADMVRWVRRKINYGGMIDSPVTFFPDDRVSDLQCKTVAHGWNFTSFPIVSRDTGQLVGLVTRHELDFVEDDNPQLGEIMKPRNKIVTAEAGTMSIVAYNIMKTQKINKLPIVDQSDVLLGMYVWNDVKNDHDKKELFSLDNDGHFLVGAAIGFGAEDTERAKLLVHSAGCKLLVLDSSHGACRAAKEQLRRLREEFGNRVDIIVGNIASYESAKYLLEGPHRPDALKVGIGPGSICTTRLVTGHGVPQLTAIYQVWRAVRDYSNGAQIGIIADGGIRTSGDIVKAFAAGASGVMLGSVLAGTTESPGRIVEMNGRQFKTIRGMGSRSALADQSGSRARYHQQQQHTQEYYENSTAKTDVDKQKRHQQQQQQHAEHLTLNQKQKLVPEGVQGLVEYKGSIAKVIAELRGGIQSGLAHSGASTIDEFRQVATVWTQSNVGGAEGRPHDIQNIIN